MLCDGVHSIDVSGTGLYDLPTALWDSPGNLDYVQLIDVSNNHLDALPPRLLFWVGGLKKLDASRNNLPALPVQCPSCCVRCLVHIHVGKSIYFFLSKPETKTFFLNVDL